MRQLEQALYRQRQALGVIHLFQRTGVAQQRADFQKVEQMRPAQHRLGQRRWLQQVMPAVGHQAAADKSGVGQCVQKQQLAHCVAQHDLGCGIDRLATGAAHGGKTFTAAQFEHRVEPLRVARHQYQ